jgi:hypothetical protein
LPFDEIKEGLGVDEGGKSAADGELISRTTEADNLTHFGAVVMN